MAIETVVKLIGTTGDFSTPQLWEDGAPADLTTAERSNCTTFLVANFAQGEVINFSPSTAVGKMLDTNNLTYMTYGITSGNPATGDTITGATSLGTCVLTSGTPNFTGVIWQGQCLNQEFSGAGTQLTVSGSTTSTTAYKELTTFAGASFRDNANVQTNALRYNASNGCGIKGTSDSTLTVDANENYCKIKNVQILAIGDFHGWGLSLNGTGCDGDNLIIEGTATGASATVGILQALTDGNISNTLVTLRASGADHIVGTGTSSPNFYNCTIVTPDDYASAPTSIFLSGASGTVTVQNCGLFAGNSTKAVKAGSATFNFTTCYSDISGTTGVTQAAYSSEFRNVLDGTRDYRLVGGAAQKDTGTTDATHAQIDIAKTRRPSASAYDVGCWEFAAVAALRALVSYQAA